jgi:hypothetical protein
MEAKTMSSDRELNEFFLGVSATLGAHEKIIIDLLVNVIGRLQNPLVAFDEYAAAMKERPPISRARPGQHPVEADQMNQMIAEAIDRTLKAARSDLQKVLREDAARHRSRDVR